MRRMYLFLIQKELDKAYLHNESIMVLDCKKDKYMLSDGKRFILAHGSKILSRLRSLKPHAKYEEIWKCLRDLKK